MQKISWTQLREYVTGLEGKARIFEREAADLARQIEAERKGRQKAERALEQERSHRDARFEAVKRERDESRRRVREAEKEIERLRGVIDRDQADHERIVVNLGAEIERLRTAIDNTEAAWANDRGHLTSQRDEARKRAESMAFSVDQKKKIIDTLEAELAQAEGEADALRANLEQMRRWKDDERQKREAAEAQVHARDLQKSGDGNALLPLIRAVPGFEDFDGDPLEGASRILRRIRADRAREDRLRADLGELRASLMAATERLNHYDDIAKAVTGERDHEALAAALVQK